MNSDTETVEVVGAKSDDALWMGLSPHRQAPRDARCVEELAELWGCSEPSAYDRARQLAKMGTLIDVGLCMKNNRRRRFWRIAT